MERWSPSLAARYESIGALAASSVGTTVTASGTPNTKGTPVSLGQTTFSWHWVQVAITRSSAAADFVIDIMVDDGSSNRFTLVENLRHYSKGAADNPAAYFLPLHVPSGARLYARSSSSTASATVRVSVVGCSTGLNGAAGHGQCAGLWTPANSRGVSISAGGFVNTKNTWFALTASSTIRVRAILLGIGAIEDTARANPTHFLIDVGVGASGSQQVLVPNLSLDADPTSDALGDWVIGPLPCDVPAGTAWWVRAQCSAGTTDALFDFALYGLG